MKLFLLALLALSPLAHAATPWEALVQKTLREGEVVQSPYGLFQSLEHRDGNDVAYVSLEIDPDTHAAKRYTAVLEHREVAADGKTMIDQHLYWFTPAGELTVTAHYQILFRADASLESRKELAYGVAPTEEDEARWSRTLASWAAAL
jgi:hypothetical protein